MSEYHDPTYQEAYPAGARAHGGEAVYGDDGVAYGDDGAAYGDEGPLYGDGGASYGDDGAAYGDEGPAYGDQGAYGGDYDAAAEYDPYADPDQLYADDGLDPFADEQLDEAVGATPVGKKKKGGKPPAKPAGASKKPLILAAVGLALVGALGAGGYFLFMAPSGGEGQGAGPSAGFDLASLTQMIPFMGPKDSDETIAANQANVIAVKRAVDIYARENGRLPSTSSAIESQLETIGVELSHPYDQGQEVAIELAEAPSAPGAVAYTPNGTSYELRVGDATGKTLVDGENEVVMSGQVPQGVKPKAPKAGSPTGGAKVAAQPKARPTLAPGMGPDDVEWPEDAAAPDDAPQPTAQAPAAPVAAAPVATPVPTPTPSLTPLAVLRKRNQEFDKLRNEGIGLLYQKRTAEAIVAFRRALLLKPNDVTVRRWLETIQGVVDKHTREETQRLKKDRAELLQRARVIAPPPAPVPDAQRREHEAMKLLDELKEDRAPALAPPKLEN